MKTILLSIALITGILGFSHHPDSSNTRPFQLSFFYPMGTNGLESPKYVNNVSFNVLAGVNGGVQGIEIGGLVNSNTGNVFGIQAAGIANLNGGVTSGIIVSGIANVCKDSSYALMFAGISNVVGANATGIYGAGISNTINGNFNGIQAGGITNIINGDAYALQAAGISNFNNGNFTGLQAAGISNLISGDLLGGQISLINRAGKVTGTQIGLINFAQSYERGVPFGLLSIVKEGYHALEFSAEEAIYANVKLKLGVDRLYTTYRVGFTEGQNENLITFGMGIGSQIHLNEKLALGIDLSSNHINRSNSFWELEMLNKADFAIRYTPWKPLTVFAGPSFNVYLTENPSDEAALKMPYTFFEDTWWNGQGSTNLWFGAQAGIAVNF